MPSLVFNKGSRTLDTFPHSCLMVHLGEISVSSIVHLHILSFACAYYYFCGYTTIYLINSLMLYIWVTENIFLYQS